MVVLIAGVVVKLEVSSTDREEMAIIGKQAAKTKGIQGTKYDKMDKPCQSEKFRVTVKRNSENVSISV